MAKNYSAVNLMATTARGIETFEIEDQPDASFENCLDDFRSCLRSMDDDEIRFYQILPAGTDGEWENLDEEYGIRTAQGPAPVQIRASRKNAGLTQEQAARVIGATRRAWQEWEAGRRNMPGAKWELFLRKSKEATMLTLSDLIDKFGANGVIRIDAGNGCAGPMWCAWDDDLAGEIGGLEMSSVDPDGRAYEDGDNERTYKQEAIYVIGDYDSDEMYASRWIHGGNGYMYRFIF